MRVKKLFLPLLGKIDCNFLNRRRFHLCGIIEGKHNLDVFQFEIADEGKCPKSMDLKFRPAVASRHQQLGPPKNSPVETWRKSVFITQPKNNPQTLNAFSQSIPNTKPSIPVNAR